MGIEQLDAVVDALSVVVLKIKTYDNDRETR